MQRVLLYILLVTATSFHPYQPKSEMISGVVINSLDQQPVKDAYVYVVRGEEEGLTNKEGIFSFTVTVTSSMHIIVQHPGFKPFVSSVSKFQGNKILLVPSEN